MLEVVGEQRLPGRFVLYGDKVAPALRPDSFPERGGEELLLGGLRLSDFEVRLKAVP